MLLIYSFLFCGFVCCVAQIILDNTKLTPGHITSLFVILGSFLDIFSIYDKIMASIEKDTPSIPDLPEQPDVDNSGNQNPAGSENPTPAPENPSPIPEA